MGWVSWRGFAFLRGKKRSASGLLCLLCIVALWAEAVDSCFSCKSLLNAMLGLLEAAKTTARLQTCILTTSSSGKCPQVLPCYREEEKFGVLARATVSITAWLV